MVTHINVKLWQIEFMLEGITPHMDLSMCVSEDFKKLTLFDKISKLKP